MKNFIKFVSQNNESNRYTRHWGTPLVEPVGHGETKGVLLFMPFHKKDKLAIFHCLDRVNSVLDICKPRGQICFSGGLFLCFPFFKVLTRFLSFSFF